MYRQVLQADDSGENGQVQLSWSGQRYMVLFCTISGTYHPQVAQVNNR